MLFEVTVVRVDTWSETIKVRDLDRNAARRRIQKHLATGGWSEVFGDSDGDLLDSESKVTHVKVVRDER